MSREISVSPPSAAAAFVWLTNPCVGPCPESAADFTAVLLFPLIAGLAFRWRRGDWQSFGPVVLFGTAICCALLLLGRLGGP
jgi:hypothetical protein